MKIFKMIKIDITTGKTIAEESFEYNGPLALAVSSVSGYGDPNSAYDNYSSTGLNRPETKKETESNNTESNDNEDSGSSAFNREFRGNYDLGANEYISRFNKIAKKVDRSMSKYVDSSGYSNSSGSTNQTDLSVKGFIKSVLHGVSYSVHMMVKDISNLAVNGPPLARVAIGIAGVSIAAPAIEIFGSTNFYFSNAPKITSIIGGPLKCQPTLTQGIKQGYKEVQRYFDE